MCDNLGISDEKVLVPYTYEGQTLVEESAETLLAFLQAEIESLGEGDGPLEIVINRKVMTRSQIEALPEFDGF